MDVSCWSFLRMAHLAEPAKHTLSLLLAKPSTNPRQERVS